MRRIASQQALEFLNGKTSLFQDVRERRSFDGLMRRNNELQRSLGRMLLQPNVAASLPHDDPPSPT
jgi:hypothetical protein